MKSHREKRGVGTYKKKPLPISQAEEKANKEYELARAKMRQIKLDFGNTFHISLRDCLDELNHNEVLYNKSIERGLPSKDYKKKIYEGTDFAEDSPINYPTALVCENCFTKI